MLFLRPPSRNSKTLAVFSGAFDPPTVAHVSLASAMRGAADEVLWVLPRRFPHKGYEGVPMPDRARLLLEATSDPVGVAESGLYFDIAREANDAIPDSRILLLAGEDGARRIVEWNYPELPDKDEYLRRNLSRFPVYSARRRDAWQVPQCFSAHFHWLDLHAAHREISSTEVRKRIAAATNWRSLVPSAIHATVDRLYGSAGSVKGQ